MFLGKHKQSYRTKHNKIIMFLGKQRYVKEGYDALTINGKTYDDTTLKWRTSVHHRMPLMSEHSRHGMGESISNTFTQLLFLSEGCKAPRAAVKGKTHQFFFFKADTESE